jgi:hypothetical protein
MALPRTTSKEEIGALLEGRGALGAERLVSYNIFLTDAFDLPSSYRLEYAVGPGIPDKIDGWDNDDSYRRSRRLTQTASSESWAVNRDNLRENSLARQLDSKRDRPATIRLIRRKKPEEMPKKESSEPRLPWVNLIPPNTKFFLEQVQENREEKVQVIDTFGEWIAFFFGRRPEIYSYTGTLLNANNHDWKNEFQENYDHFLRGSQAVKNRATIIMQYDDVVVEGYMLNSSITQTSVANNSVPFQFNLLVINRSPLNPRRMMALRFQRSARSVAENLLFNDMQEALDLSQAGRLDELQTFLIMREYFSGNYVASAGKVTHRVHTNNVESDASVAPGQNSGLANEALQPASFVSEQTTALDGAGVEIPE